MYDTHYAKRHGLGGMDKHISPLMWIVILVIVSVSALSRQSSRHDWRTIIIEIDWRADAEGVLESASDLASFKSIIG